MSMSNSSSFSSGQSTSNSFIPNYPQSSFLMALAGKLTSYADQQFRQYDSTFTPLQASLIARSNQEFSPDYQRWRAGQAIAGAEQLGNAARNNALRDLGAFGVGDPSNVGRRFGIEAEEENKTAATATGAANEAINTARNEGRMDQNQAIANEQQVANRAAGLQQTAMSLKYPPLGNNAQSTQQGSSQSHSQGPSPNQNSGNQRNPSNSSTSDGSGGFNPQHGSGPTNQTVTNPFTGGANVIKVGTGLQDAANQVEGPPADNNISYADQTDQFGNPWQVGSDTMTGPNQVAITDYGSSDQNYNQGFDYGSPDLLGPNNINIGDTGYGSDLQNTNDAFNFSPDSSAVDNTPVVDNSFDPSYSDTSYPTADNSDYTDYSSDGGALGGVPGTDFARDKGVLPLQGGGPAPVSASPSRGAKTDDIKAKVNADEFVIPRDVAVFKGHEHFYKLMEKSRQTRMEYQRGIHKPPGSKK